MAHRIIVSYRDAIRGQWTADIEDDTGYTETTNGVTKVFGARLGQQQRMELAAISNEMLMSVTFNPVE